MPEKQPAEIRFDPIQIEPVYRKVTNLIERKIVSGEIEIGQAFPSEAELAAQFRVARSTIREAIRCLEQAGLAHRRMGEKKLYVSVPDKAGLVSRMSVAMQLHKVSFEELWETIMALEPANAHAAARRATAEQLQRIRNNIQMTREAVDKKDRLIELDIEFHDLICEASDNAVLQLSHWPVAKLLHPAVAKFIHESPLEVGQRLLSAHEKIFDAISSQDSSRAEQWMKRHIIDFLRGYEMSGFDPKTTLEPGPLAGFQPSDL